MTLKELEHKHNKAHLILLFMIKNMNQEHIYSCTFDKMCDKLYISESTARNNVALLKHMGYLTISKNKDRSNIYLINTDMIKE